MGSCQSGHTSIFCKKVEYLVFPSLICIFGCMLLADNILQATALGTVLECKSINGKWPRPNPGLQSYRITKRIFSQSFLTSSLQTNNKRQHNYCLPIFESKCPLLTPASKALFFMTFKICCWNCPHCWVAWVISASSENMHDIYP